jgi:hypothetical protein
MLRSGPSEYRGKLGFKFLTLSDDDDTRFGGFLSRHSFLVAYALLSHLARPGMATGTIGLLASICMPSRLEPRGEVTTDNSICRFIWMGELPFSKSLDMGDIESVRLLSAFCERG